MNKKYLFSIISVILIFSLFFTSCGTEKAQDGDFSDFYDEGIAVLGAGEIIKSFAYSGEFIEDGSRENKSNVLALIFKSTVDNDIQLLEFDVTSDDETYHFKATTIPSHGAITILEANGKQIDSQCNIQSIQVNRLVFFENEISLHPDNFEITELESVVNIKNISGAAIEGIYVYYKQYDKSGFFGGITFRANVGRLENGEIRQLPLKNFNSSTHKVVFVTYV